MPLPRRQPIAVWAPAAVCLAAAVALAGCSSSMVALRHSPLAAQLHLVSTPKPSPRTLQFLRVYGLEKELAGDPQTLLAAVQKIADREPSADKVYAVAELSYLLGRRVEPDDPRLAMDYYGASVLQAYQYLFASRYRHLRNPYDPQFRGACDLYNAALERGLRRALKADKLLPGKSYMVRTAAGDWHITCVLRSGRWQAEDFDRFEFASDYELSGLRNRYQSYGLGVPLIAVRRSYPGEPAAAKYYPPSLSFPVTAFLRPVPRDPGAPSGVREAMLELYDPLSVSDIPVEDVVVPLESDLTTPLAFFLSNPKINALATVGLFHPETLLAARGARPDPVMGLYMVQPYEPGKIPVILVHGFWSSPMTWIAMFNDLRSIPEIRDRYQFWFYLYPTGQPFWTSAAQLRRDLAEARALLDPGREEPALDRMVLVGHSMGGLIARLQTLSSGDDYWRLVSDRPFDQLKGDEALRGRLAECFFFQASPSVRRVVTIATPHRGTKFANGATRWLADRALRVPRMVSGQDALSPENKEMFPAGSLLLIETSVDSLAPASPILPVMLAAPRPPWVKYHNIVGMLPQRTIWGKLLGGDGVVSHQSAKIDDAQSETIVPADHTTIQTHPLAVLEVRRILLEHLAELDGAPADPPVHVARSTAD